LTDSFVFSLQLRAQSSAETSTAKASDLLETVILGLSC